MPCDGEIGWADVTSSPMRTPGLSQSLLGQPIAQVTTLPIAQVITMGSEAALLPVRKSRRQVQADL